MGKRRLPGERAWAWKYEYGLCRWAEPDKASLVKSSTKPSPEAKAVLVRLIEENELRHLVKTAENQGRKE